MRDFVQVLRRSTKINVSQEKLKVPSVSRRMKGYKGMAILSNPSNLPLSQSIAKFVKRSHRRRTEVKSFTLVGWNGKGNEKGTRERGFILPRERGMQFLLEC